MTLNYDQDGVLMIHPTVSGGREWFSSDTWNNGQSRGLTDGDSDPYDSALTYRDGDPVTFTIDGSGVGSNSVITTSIRLFVEGPWTNTEMSVWTKKATLNNTDIQMRSRANHDLGNCYFGNYGVSWEHNRATSSHQVEVLHGVDGVYHRFLGNILTPFPGFTANQWFGTKQITRTIGGKVRVEAYHNLTPEATPAAWVKQNEFWYDGRNVSMDQITTQDLATCLSSGDQLAGNLKAGTLKLTSGADCWIRSNNVSDLQVTNYSVREIEV